MFLTKHHYNIYQTCGIFIVAFVTAVVSQGGGPGGHYPAECNVAIGLHIESCKTTFDDSATLPHLETCQENNTSPICMHHRVIARIKNEPFTSTLIPGFLVSEVMPLCCGCHPGINQEDEYSNTTEFFYKNPSVGNNNVSTIIFPVFGSTNAEKLYGLNWAPMFSLNEGLYLTLQPEKDDTMKALLSGILQLGPLLCICLLLALIAGFIGWLIETWNNDDQFRRPFLLGLSDGFWWSFVSMTTVGYGDKAPCSTAGKIFSVFWILSGITICSMFTASLTNAITDAAVGPPPSIEQNNRVGILGDRLFESTLVVAKGALPFVYYTLADLKEALENEEIDGILLDIYTKLFYQSEFTTYRESYEMWSSESVSYGILYSKLDEFVYFGKTIKDNQIALKTCLMIGSSKFTGKDAFVAYGIFSPKSGLFYPFLGASLGTILIILIFGFLYEQFRKKKKGSKIGSNMEMEKSNNTRTEDTDNKQDQQPHQKTTVKPISKDSDWNNNINGNQPLPLIF